MQSGRESEGERPEGGLALEAFVEVRDLRKVFNGITAVDGVTFSIQRGEIFGLLGPNGAGKTTTIRMMATTLPMTSGDVIVAGHSAHEDPGAV
ncbi:MAG TPA: ATP-binding cassette domain-containing protein, partial [Firmicutes bacterium]|nr:ATP-binding cassette domain-containing protein [Bacillota bacterium]